MSSAADRGRATGRGGVGGAGEAPHRPQARGDEGGVVADPAEYHPGPGRPPQAVLEALTARHEDEAAKLTPPRSYP